MAKDLKKALDRFNALNNREKVMTTAGLILVLWAAWDNLFYQSHKLALDNLDGEILNAQNNLNSQRLIAQQLAQFNQDNPLQERLTSLNATVGNLKQQLTAGERKLVPAADMAEALRGMLQQQGNLQLVKLETLPAQPYGNAADQPVWVYRHAIEVTVTGDFFSTLNYLKALETLPWRIHWDSISYQVEQYPQAQTRFQVFTLSFEKDWLGA